jgi:hypothetical protein
VRAVPGREGDVWVALYDGGLARSTDGGASFSLLRGVRYAAAVGFGKAAPGADYPTVYIWGEVGGVRGVFRSTDAAPHGCASTTTSTSTAAPATPSSWWAT